MHKIFGKSRKNSDRTTLRESGRNVYLFVYTEINLIPGQPHSLPAVLSDSSAWQTA